MSLNKFTIQKSFAISAGAGSGKTYTLSRRYINALLGFDYFREDYLKQKSCFETLNPARVNQIVTITYTEAAALEMKGRIFELVAKIINPQLDSKDNDYASIQEANKHLNNEEIAYVKKALQQAYIESSNAKISTIHAFCLDIIKVNADLAQIDTQLDIIKEDEKAQKLSTIIFDVLNKKSNQETVLDIAKDISMYFLDSLINTYVGSSKFRKDYDRFDKESIDRETYKELIRELYKIPEPCDELIEEIKNAKDAEKRQEWFDEYLENFANFEAQPWRSFTFETVYKSGPNKGQPKQATLGLGEKTFPFLDAYVNELDSLVDIYSTIDTDLEALFFDKIDKIKILLHQIKKQYDARLEELGKIDFDTIITRTLDIISLVKTNFKYIMVDEFQDTNETQFEIVKNAMNKETNLFVVGDSKQSIYSFQGAEIEVFNNAVEDKKLFSSVEDMSMNYRSDGVVLKTVNAIFREVLKKDENLKIISQNYEAYPQDLKVSKPEKEEKGSFKFLITSQEYKTNEQKKEETPISEMETIANFVSEVYQGKDKAYLHISELIQKQEKAIAIVFDSSTKMLELKSELRDKGITAKISASDNFFHTKEINDIFNVLKAIDILWKKLEPNSARNYYLVGAMRSNIIRCDDNHIKQHIDNRTVDEKLLHYVEVFAKKPLAEAVKYIYDDSNVMGVYAHLDDVEQRVANLYKFLNLCLEYQESRESNLYQFLQLLENSIYFSEAEEEEAFFKSDNTKSIEICSIHSTKGLAYPMVLLANADKKLYSQISSDALKHNNFTLLQEDNQSVKKELVGFKINKYVPLSHRALKQIDKLKHLAEKKRLLYVALTRAEHDIVISAQLKEKKDGDITLGEDSYLHMICESLNISKEQLFKQDKVYCVDTDDIPEEIIVNKIIEYIDHALKPIEFTSTKPISATQSDEVTEDINTEAAQRGTIIHHIIEHYWKNFSIQKDKILDKMAVFDESDRVAIIKNMEHFYKSEAYKHLQSGTEYRFELEFNVDNTHGFIDLIYFDVKHNGWVIVDFKTGIPTSAKEKKYQEQLMFYKNAIETLGYQVKDTQILWI